MYMYNGSTEDCQPGTGKWLFFKSTQVVYTLCEMLLIALAIYVHVHTLYIHVHCIYEILTCTSTVCVYLYMIQHVHCTLALSL